MGQADYQPDIHSVYAGVRWITDELNDCMNGSCRLL